MNHYITETTIKALREKNQLTQLELSSMLGVSDKTISKWETSRGLPDISLMEPLAKALCVSVAELLTGECVTNHNVSGNMLRSRFYVCPICGNSIHSTGEIMVSCCGITLPALEAEECDDIHDINLERTEDETFISLEHPMKKSHYISFLAYASSGKFEMLKLYPEQSPEGRFLLRGHGILYAYCNKHGLFKKRF